MGAKRNPTSRQKGRAGVRQEELPLTTQPTFKELVGWYLEAQKTHLRGRTLSSRRVMLQNAAAALPARPTTGDIHRWLAGRVERREVQGSTANLTLTVMGTVYRSARDLRYPGLLNVVAAVPRFPEVKLKPKALPDIPRDWPKCLEACEDVREQAFLSVMRRSGLRPSEALALEPRHVDLGKATVTIEKQRDEDHVDVSPLKTDTSAATLSLHPETVELLRKVLAAKRARERGVLPAGEKPRRGAAERRYLFPFYGAELKGLLARLRAAVPGAFAKREVGNTGGAAFHVFRHTFATALANTGMADRDLHVLLRHKHLVTTARYVGSIRGRVQPVDALNKAWAAELAAEEAALAQGQQDTAGEQPATHLPTSREGKRVGSVAGVVSPRKGSRK
jgi:integrase